MSWKGVLFCVVLSRISYESFYGQILPDAARIAVVVGLQIVLMRIATMFFRGIRR